MIKLLVVDDELDICDFVSNFFKERNFEVFIANNGQEAIELVKAEKPGIVLLDMMMPVMDGLEALKLIKEIDDRINVIMVTAVEDTEMYEEAKRHGAMEYITKPLMLEQLERTVLTVSEQIKMG